MVELQPDKDWPQELTDIYTDFVYDDKKTPFACALNYSDIKANTNKAYVMQLATRDNKVFFLFTKGGRVGIGSAVSVQCFFDRDIAIKSFVKQFINKTGISWSKRFDEDIDTVSISKGQYQFIAMKYAIPQAQIEVVKHVSPKLDKAVDNLMDIIFNHKLYDSVAAQYKLDTAKLPLGALSMTQIDKAMKILGMIKETLVSKTDHERLTELSSLFYTTIPTSAGTKGLTCIDTKELLSDKYQLLEVLKDLSYVSRSVGMSHYDKYLSLKTEIKLVTDSSVLRLINDYVSTNYGSTHHVQLKVDQIFQLSKESEQKHFKKWENLHNRQLLWHGTRAENMVGILTTGLRINPAGVTTTGKMFGNGLYFANSSSKSAGYISYSNNRHKAFMFLCEIALGTTYDLVNATNVTSLPSGKHSVRGVGKWQPEAGTHKIMPDGLIVPIGQLKQSSPSNYLNYDEFIVYDTSQIRMRYLVMFK